VDVALFVTLALPLQQMVVVNADAIVEGVNHAFHFSMATLVVIPSAVEGVRGASLRVTPLRSE
jgi:hypothetical protein